MILYRIDFFLKLKKVKGIEKFITIVANEREGGVNGKTVSEYTKADIKIPPFHKDPNSAAFLEWKDMMNNGIVYSEILSMTQIRKRRILTYLDSIFLQINQASQ